MSMTYFRHGSRDEPTVALTFDDGPNPPRTEEVLDILDGFGVKGTFFLIGKWVELYPRTVDRIVAGGHCVGNHSHEHQIRVSDYDLAESVIAHATGRRTRFSRPHSFDFASLGNSLISRMSTTTVIDADVNPRDYAQNDPEAIVQGVLDHADLDNGSIIDLHDGIEIVDVVQRHSRPLPMIDALPTIISSLIERGLQPVTLDKMTFDDQHTWQDGDETLLNTNPTPDGVIKRVH